MPNTRNPALIEVARATLRRIAFEALYSRFAWAYDWVSGGFFLGQWRAWQRASLHFLQGTRILEVGMGTGDLQVDLARAGYEAWGIDLSPQMLRQAARKARSLGKPLRACRARAQALPFPSDCFDSLVSTFPSDYIIKPQTLSELSRVLRPGGRLVIVPAGWLSPRGAKGRALERLARLVYGEKGVKARHVPAEEQVMKRVEASLWIATLKRHMAEAGFSISMHVASNERGAALIIVGRKTLPGG